MARLGNPKVRLRKHGIGLILLVVLVASVHTVITGSLGDHGGEKFESLLGMAFFVLGMFLAFALDHARTSQSQALELLKGLDSDLLTLYRLSRQFGEDNQTNLRNLIDLHLQDQIDFPLVDFSSSTGSYLDILEFAQGLEPRDSRLEIVWDHMLGILVTHGERRKQLESLLSGRVSLLEWGGLLTMFSALWVLVVLTSGTDVLASVLGVALMLALTSVLWLLNRLDKFAWQESDAIWKPLHTLFVNLDLVPYYAADMILKGRLTDPGGDLRLASYPKGFPDSANKRVEVVSERERHPS